MLSEGLKNVNNASVIIGIVERNELKGPEVLLEVSKEGFSTSARVFLLEYCKVKIGFGATQEFLEKHADDPRLAWAVKYFGVKKKLASEPDAASRRLVDALCDGTDEDVIKAVDAGGCVMTSDMLLYTLPLSDVSDDTLRYVFANAMSLPVRCLSELTLGEELHRDGIGGTKMYDALCNMSTIIIDLLIKDEGITGMPDEDTARKSNEDEDEDREEAGEEAGAGDEYLFGLTMEELRAKYDVESKTLSCPNCGREAEMPIFDVVNVTEHPELREKVLNKEIFTFACPHCGTRKLLLYPMLFRDDKLRLVVEVCQSRQAALDFRFPLDIPSCRAMAETHDLRAVVGTNGLVEKIRVMEAKKNELAVAYLKKSIAEQREEAESVWFAGIRGGFVCFVVTGRDGASDTVKISEEDYKRVLEYVNACGLKDRLTSYLVDTNVFEQK